MGQNLEKKRALLQYSARINFYTLRSNSLVQAVPRLKYGTLVCVANYVAHTRIKNYHFIWRNYGPHW